MRFVFSKGAKRFFVIFAISFIFVLAILNVGGYFLNLKHVSVIAANAEIDKYQVRSELLMQATDEIGVCLAKDAVEVWADGLEKRSAALQYSVLSKALKDEYAKQLEKSFPNWVTGMSSPWVDDYRFTKYERMGENKYIYNICFFTKTSTGPAGNYNATLTVEKDGNFWRITKLETDKGLYPYTGFKT